MSDILLKRRIALARLEAGLIKAGFSTHANVTVKIGPEDHPDDVQQQLLEACDLAGSVSDNQPVWLANLHGDDAGEPTHAVAVAEAVNVPDQILEVLANLAKSLPQTQPSPTGTQTGTVKIDTSKSGWRLCIDHGSSPASGIVLYVETLTSPHRKFQLQAHAGVFSRALGVPVRLDFGQVAGLHDQWAHKALNVIATGVSVGTSDAGASVTLPTRYTDPARAAQANAAMPRLHSFVTVAHAFTGNEQPKTGGDVFQPAHNTNPDRRIGKITEIDYLGYHDAVNFFDAAVVETTQAIGSTMGKDDRIIGGMWQGPIAHGDRLYIFGASSGMRPVHIEYAEDVTVTMLTKYGQRVIYKDMIEFCNDGDDTKPATLAGDSGGALLVRASDRYWVAGLIVGGGTRTAKARRPRSYAVPIGRILKRFKLTAY